MKIILKKLRTLVDAGKTRIDLEHVFQPLKGEKDLKVHCLYFKPGEMTSYISYTQEGKASIDFQKVFRDKVTRIEGLSIETDKETFKVDTAEDLLALPNTPVLTDIVMKTAEHIVSSDGLTEDEEKNLD